MPETIEGIIIVCMKEFNWNEFIKRITINAEPRKIYQAWATQQGLESWFLRKAEFTSVDNTIRKKDEYIQPNDKYQWLWFGYPDATAETNTVIETNGTDYLKFYFSGNCIVSVHIKKENGEFICELNQDMTTAPKEERQFFYIECGKGWVFYLTNLKSILEGGIDLRNKNEQIRSVINA
ncbi:MAG: hypothetical protein JST87_06385 [Bacteroidetes bacterium]|nr:hypothetical protein [Bacteroidota bacterium]